MTRPSQNIDKKLIELGKSHVIEHGISSLSIRSICMAAGVNLGMFYYYFKTKKDFIRILINGFIEDMSKDFMSFGGAQNMDPLEKLKRTLLMNVRMMKEKKGIMQAIIKDIDFKDEAYLKLFKDLHNRAFEFYGGLIKECKEIGYFPAEYDDEQVCAFFIGAMSTYTKLIDDKCEAEEFYVRAHNMFEFLLSKLIIKSAETLPSTPPPPPQHIF